MHAKSRYPSNYSFRDLSVHPDEQTDGQGQIDTASDPDQEYIYLTASDPDQDYIYFIGSETLSFYQ